jgi:transposase
MASSGDRDRMVEVIIGRLREQLEKELPNGPATLDQVEEIAGRLGRDLSRDVQERVIDKEARGPRENRAECQCGGQARYKGMPSRTVVTAHGTLTYRRPCYHCSACRRSFSPLEDALGVRGCTTEQVRLWSACLSAQLPFAQAATTLALLTRVNLSAATLERVSVAVGRALRAEEEKQARLHQQGELSDARKSQPRRLYVGMVGLFVPLRDAWKKDGSQGALSCRWGECKVGVVYEPYQGRDGRDARVRTRAYTATFKSVEEFGPFIGTLAHENGHHWAKEVIVIGDGAPWIWNIAGKQFTRAVQIVDFFHACQHLAALADARFGTEADEGQEWQTARQEDLKNNRLDVVLADIKAWRPSNTQKQQLRRTAYSYFYNNSERMQYKTFLEQGYHIGSGVVEATCKHLIAQRMDQAGMHWRPETAEAIAALRATQCSSTPADLRPYCRMAA